MPSLRAHAVFLCAVRDAAPSWQAPLVDAAAVLDAHWPEAVLGTFAPDAWPIYGGTRAGAHGLSKEDPATWEGGVERWLSQAPGAPGAAPGREVPPAKAAFLLGYLAHLCLDNWSLYLEPALPAAARTRAPADWFPPTLCEPNAARVTLRALAEAPIPAARCVPPEALACAPIPAAFQADAIRRLAVGLAPAFPETDPWRISRIGVLRNRPDTPEAHQEWLARRATDPAPRPDALAQLVSAALDYTRRTLERWW